jgi:hypothetical protein
MNSPMEHKQFLYIGDAVNFINENSKDWDYFQIVIVPESIEKDKSIVVNYRVFFIVKAC